MVKNSRLGHDLPISVNDRIFHPFGRVIFSRNFAYSKFHENKTLAKIFEFTVDDDATMRSYSESLEIVTLLEPFSHE